jgi:hypothetical protein
MMAYNHVYRESYEAEVNFLASGTMTVNKYRQFIYRKDFSLGNWGIIGGRWEKMYTLELGELVPKSA